MYADIVHRLWTRISRSFTPFNFPVCTGTYNALYTRRSFRFVFVCQYTFTHWRRHVKVFQLDNILTNMCGQSRIYSFCSSVSLREKNYTLSIVENFQLYIVRNFFSFRHEILWKNVETSSAADFVVHNNCTESQSSFNDRKRRKASGMKKRFKNTVTIDFYQILAAEFVKITRKF